MMNSLKCPVLDPVAVVVVEVVIILITLIITIRMHLGLLAVMAVENSNPIPMDMDMGMDMILTMNLTSSMDSIHGLSMTDPDPVIPTNLATTTITLTTLTTNEAGQVPTFTLVKCSTAKAEEAQDMDGA